MIPKVIHYCWFGNNKLPSDVKRCIKSWKKYCPDYDIVQWTEKNFDVNENSFVKTAYEKGGWAFVSDYARLKIVHDYGGIYLDTDVELVKSLDKIIDTECFVATQAEPHLIATGLGFGAVKGHYIIKEMLQEYDNITFDIKRKNDFICPKLNTNPLVKRGYNYSNEIQKIGDISIYPSRYFDPINSNGFNFTEDTVSIHHYSATWEKGTHRLKRKLAQIIGPRFEGKIKQLIKR